MAETECKVCDTFWRLYSLALDHLQELVAKHRDARQNNDANTVEVLTHEIAIAESALGSVRREMRRHERARHSGERRQQPQDQKQPEKKSSGGAT